MNMNWTGIGFYLFLALFLLPPLLVVGSSKVRGYEKLCWTLISLFLSWLGFLVFMVVHGGRTATTRG